MVEYVELAGGTFAERVQEAIDYSGKTRPQIAQECGFSPQTLFKWLRGGKATEENLLAFAKATGVSYRVLRDGREAMVDKGKRAPPAAGTPTSLESVEALDILGALPEDQRAMWIALGHWLVQRYGAQGVAKPFLTPPPPR